MAFVLGFSIIYWIVIAVPLVGYVLAGPALSLLIAFAVWVVFLAKAAFDLSRRSSVTRMNRR